MPRPLLQASVPIPYAPQPGPKFLSNRVTNAGLGAAFPEGLFVAQDNDNGGDNQNFKLVPWGAIARAADPPLAVDTGWDPRAVGAEDATAPETAIDGGPAAA